MHEFHELDERFKTGNEVFTKTFGPFGRDSS